MVILIHTLEIYELIDALEDFVESERTQVFDIGEAVGCNLLRTISEVVVQTIPFNRILFVMGSPDAAYAIDRPNVMYWKWLFNDFLVDGVEDTTNPLWDVNFKSNYKEYVQQLIPDLLVGYDVIIINQAQLIPFEKRDMITKVFSGQIIRIFDPYDMMGEGVDVPIRCVDTFEKLPLTIAYARSLYGIETRCINKRATNRLETGVTIRRNSVGRIDSNQYVTSDFNLMDDCWNRQKSSQFRKNQKVYVLDTKMNIVQETEYQHVHSLGMCTLLHIEQGNEDGIIRFHIHSTNAVFDKNLTYTYDKFTTPSNAIMVAPANVLPVGNTLNSHYFKQIVYVTTKDTPMLSIREQYTMLKQSQNLIIASTK